MKKIVLALLLVLTSLFADVSYELQKGWQFIGFSTNIDDMSLFDENESVSIIWSYDAKTQKWQGFSPDHTTQSKINKKYSPLKSIKSSQGIWIENKKSWTLTIKGEHESKSTLTLYKGWNLISLPVDVAVSPKLFDDSIVWRYSLGKWQLYGKKSSHYPPISSIHSTEAIWVKSDKEQTISLDNSTSKLHSFSSKEELKSYIKEMILNSYKHQDRFYPVVDSIMEDVSAQKSVEAPQADSANQATDATSTNIQEVGVDESDILKHNDTHLFFYNMNKNEIEITTFENLKSNRKSAISPIKLENGTQLKAMYLVGDRLAVVTQRVYYYIMYKGAPEAVVEGITKPTKEDDFSGWRLKVYDISEISNITKLGEFKVDGDFRESRMIEGKLYAVSSFRPEVEIVYPKIDVDQKKCEQFAVKPMYIYAGTTYLSPCDQYDYSKPTIKSLNISPMINGDVELIDYKKTFAPNKIAQFPLLTTVAEFDINSLENPKTVTLTGDMSDLYVSKNNLYLLSNEYPIYRSFREFKSRVAIYKVGLKDLSYEALGFVNGRVLNSYSLSEYKNHLRVATTQGRSWGFTQTKNSLFVMKQNSNSLEIVGTLTGLGALDNNGESREEIKAVRFVGDRGFIVTAKQTDPLYTLDLSNPTSPQKVGELKVSGFSEYLHPLDNNRILSIGRELSEDGRRLGFMIELFNINDFAHPSLIDKVLYPKNVYSFDAEHDPRAFVYRSSDGLLGITYRDQHSSSMDIYKISNTIEKVNSVDVESSGYNNRGIIFDMDNISYGAIFNTESYKSKEIGAR